MLSAKNSVKHSNNLATAELNSKRHLNLATLRKEYDDFPKDVTKGIFTLSNFYPYIFDVLTYVCTNLYKKRFSLKDGIHDVIERRQNISETHFRTVLQLSTFIKFGLDKYEDDYKEDFKSQLFKFVRDPRIKKVIKLQDNRTYYIDPIRIDLISRVRAVEFGIKEFTPEEKEKELAQLSNLLWSPKSQIEYVAIEYFKPLFESLIASNENGKIGNCYFLLPKSFQAKIKHTIKLLKNRDFIDLPDSSKTTDVLTCMEARRLFLYLNLHCNGIGDHMNIDVLDCAKSCFRTCLKTEINGNNYVSIKNHAKIIKKIELATYLYKEMDSRREMVGVKFLPIKLNRDKTNRQNFNIKVRYF